MKLFSNIATMKPPGRVTWKLMVLPLYSLVVEYNLMSQRLVYHSTSEIARGEFMHARAPLEIFSN